MTRSAPNSNSSAAPTTDVSPILAMARYRARGAIAPIEAYRASAYRAQKAMERPEVKGTSAGIV